MTVMPLKFPPKYRPGRAIGRPGARERTVPQAGRGPSLASTRLAPPCPASPHWPRPAPPRPGGKGRAGPVPVALRAESGAAGPEPEERVAAARPDQAGAAGPCLIWARARLHSGLSTWPSATRMETHPRRRCATCC